VPFESLGGSGLTSVTRTAGRPCAAATRSNVRSSAIAVARLAADATNRRFVAAS
jgi:hypothetical protein